MNSGVEEIEIEAGQAAAWFNMVLAGCHSACNFGSDAILVQLRLFRAD